MKYMRDIIKVPRYESIPSCGLYLEQVVQYLNGILSLLGFEKITLFMVKNYIKLDMVSKPINKLYYRDQIATLFFISIAKNIMSIEDVKTIIKKVEIDADGKWFEYFSAELENAMNYAGASIESETSAIDVEIICRDLVAAIIRKKRLLRVICS